MALRPAQEPPQPGADLSLPDLISASVTSTLAPADGWRALFAYLGTRMVLRDPTTARRREAMWRQQYEQLQGLQRSPANRHPNPIDCAALLVVALVGLLTAFPSLALDLVDFTGITGPLSSALTQIASLGPGIKALVGFVGFVVALI